MPENEIELISETSDPAAKKPLSEKRLAANRANAKKSSGPRTNAGKQRSSLNATRHGILAHVLHLPEEDQKAYNLFTSEYIAGLQPIGPVETQLAHTCADLHFRLHRISAVEHNLFAGNHDNPSETSTFAETLCRAKDPLATITIYEQRLSRRFLQTLKQLREIQAERRALEQQQLEDLYEIATHHANEIGNVEPAQLGFVCSNRDWRNYYTRRVLLATQDDDYDPRAAPPFNARELLQRIA
jgi:hypothetical protein